MLSVLAGWRVSLRRTLSDWPIVVAAGLTMLLATTLLAAGPIYASAVSVAGLRQTLAEASIEAGNVRVSTRVPLDRVAGVDEAVTAALAGLVGTLPAELARFGAADGFALPGQGDQIRDLAQPGFAEGVEEHATLLSGAWPVEAAGAGSTVEVAISDAVAEQLQLAVGDRLELVSRRDAELVVPVAIAAVFRIDRPRDPFWWADERAIDGLTASDQYRTFGPFLMTRADLLSRAATTSVSLSWRLLPDFGTVTTDQVAGLQAALGALPGRISTATGDEQPSIDTDLPATLATTERALLVSRTGMILLMGQLALLGGYAILLTAGLLIDHRRVETSLLRSRGAGPRQVAGLTLAEGLVLALPAVLLGPLCALVALSLFDRIGPLADAGLSVPLRVTGDAYLAAGLAGAACVALLALPVLFSARAFSAEQRSLSRAETRPLAQRLGIDLALVAAAGIALWQLRLYGAPLTRTVQGTLGPDPLLVAAPALGVLAGAVVATRLLPRLAEGAERLFARTRGLVGALGSFQLARRPLRYTRSALMLMLAMSIGVFAVAYATTWSDSQRSQADHQAAADVRVIPSRSIRALHDSALGAAYTALPGVSQAVPVELDGIQLRRSVPGKLLALDAQAAPELIRFRADQAPTSLTRLFEPLAAARPALTLTPIPEGATGAAIALEIRVLRLERLSTDPANGAQSRAAEDPAAFDDLASIAVSMALRDTHGRVHRLAAPPMTADDARSGIAIPFGGTVARELVALDARIVLPPELVLTEATFRFAEVSVHGTDVDRQALDLGPAPAWRIALLDPAQQPIVLAAESGAGVGTRVTELTTNGVDPATISLVPLAIIDMAADEIPVLASRAALDALAIGPGDAFATNLGGSERRLRITGVVDTFPTIDAAEPVLVVDLPTLALLRMQAAHAIGPTVQPVDETRRPDEWWLGLASSVEPEGIREVLSAPPFASVSVVTAAGRLRSLVSDPVPVGIIGALGLGALAAALFALIGLAVAAAVSARQRQTEFALLRALGLSRRQLAAWLWLENGSVAVISVLAGTALGAIISWVVLPSVTVTSNGLPPTPPVIVTLPLSAIAALAVVAALALAAVVLVTAAVLRRMGIGNILRLGEE